MEQLLAEGSQFARDATSHLRQGHPMLGCILRSNQIGNGLCPREVHLAVEESALRKFTRACHLATCRYQQLQGTLNDIL